MALFKPLLDLLGLTDNKPDRTKIISRAQMRRDKHKQMVAALRQYRPPDKPSQLDWLKKRKKDMQPVAPGPAPGGASGDGPDVKPPVEAPGSYQQNFQGKMPIRATDEAIALIKKYQANGPYDRIQFPKVFRESDKIIAVNSHDSSQNTSLGVVRVIYENDVNPDSTNKIGINLSKKEDADVLDCTVVYPAIPTSLNVQSQPSKIS
jgi:hypothetical protein